MLMAIINHDYTNKSATRGAKHLRLRRAFHPQELNALHPAFRAHQFESRSLLMPEIQSAWTGMGAPPASSCQLLGVSPSPL